ncbi:protein kinase BUB1 [Sugiyamaella lignohabitans]|uniref:Protein kinase BUB1 n=1 Tax=Sugiyamaella lignohabitans TaxID=796027 RepID=A0A167DVS0_9ASCO|nr:protein kinase BUB1 [Sugiyamaella lignohabitans]ANB13349.1 protein kinase BUB1 [Sugiyamaella lignohabitans]
MTFHTKAATEEVYEMFNQSLKNDSEDESDHMYSDNEEDFEEDGHDDGDDDDEKDNEYSQYQGNISSANGSKEEKASNSDEQYESYSNNSRGDEVLVSNALATPARGLQAHSRKARMPAMTPIAEATETTGPHSPILERSLVNAAHESVRRSVWHKIEPVLEAAGVYKRINLDCKKSDQFKKALKSIKTGEKSSKTASNLVIEFPQVNDIFCLKKILGEGAYGSVYLAESGSGQWKAIKVESTVLPWEFYTVLTAQERLVSSRDFHSIIGVDALYAFNDEQYMILDYISQGTALDLVNLANSVSEGNSGLEEVVAIFFTIELLRVIQSLHNVGIIHGDIKPDNIMIRLPETPADMWSKYYRRDGTEGWGEMGIVLVDFGKSIDTNLFPEGTQYLADWDLDPDQDCVEMRRNQPWDYQTDYHGLAGVIHLMLFGKFLKIQEELVEGELILRLATPFKRYWQRDLWNQLFECLLNSKLAASKLGYEGLPLNSHLENLRHQFEDLLEQKSEGQGISLKSSLIGLQQELRQRKGR